MGSILAVKSTGLGSVHKSIKRGIRHAKQAEKRYQKEQIRKRNANIRKKQHLSKGSEKSIAKHPLIQRPVKKSGIDKKRLHGGVYKIQNIKNKQGTAPKYNKWGDRIS